MTDTTEAVSTAAISTALSAVAGILGGPVLAAMVGFVTGLPIQLVLAISLVAMIWLYPVTGIWLVIVAVAAVAGFIFGVVRKPHPALYRATRRDDGGQRTAHLERQLAAASERERALLAALTAAHTPQPPVALTAPSIRGQVTS